MDNTNMELAVRSCLAEIRDRVRHPCRCTSNYIFGKEVKLMAKPHGSCLGLLQPWIISYTIDPKQDLKSIVSNVIDFFVISASAYEKAMADRLYNINVSNIVCHQLCDWIFSESDDGHVVKDNTVTLVKYALVTKDFEMAV